jgi:hypothetical protein
MEADIQQRIESPRIALAGTGKSNHRVVGWFLSLCFSGTDTHPVRW